MNSLTNKLTGMKEIDYVSRPGEACQVRGERSGSAAQRWCRDGAETVQNSQCGNVAFSPFVTKTILKNNLFYRT